MPISRVRSVTVASMMFMMPMPPTTSEMEAIMASRFVNRSLARSASSSRSSGTVTAQSSFWWSCSRSSPHDRRRRAAPCRSRDTVSVTWLSSTFSPLRDPAERM